MLKVEGEKAEFVENVISEYKASPLYQTAKIADEYDRSRNTTIMSYQKMLNTVTGALVKDTVSPNHKSTSNFFNIFVTQLNQYLLGNGVSWTNNATEKKLGTDFDNRLQDAGKKALCGAVSYGFYDVDHVVVFSALEFAPLLDEENGALSSGVRFWQLAPEKPMRATLYEPDGFTDYMWDKNNIPPEPWVALGNNAYKREKRAYKLKVRSTEADGGEIYDGENYPGFPIVPLWGNPHHVSELVGLREKIDAYDLILNGFENDLDNAQIYWIIKGAGGMDDVDLTQFLERLRLVGAAAPADGQDVSAMTINIPYAAREALLERLEKQLYRDAMIMNPEDIASGATTATQIRAAYERQNVKADQYEYCVIDFVQGILAVAGVEDEPTFTRSTIVNTQEEVQTVVMAATYLSQDYITRKVLLLMGDGDQADDVLEDLEAERMETAGVDSEGLDMTDDNADITNNLMSEFGDEVIAMLEELVEGE